MCCFVCTYQSITVMILLLLQRRRRIGSTRAHIQVDTRTRNIHLDEYIIQQRSMDSFFPFTASQPRDNLSTTSANHVPGYRRYQLSLFRFSLFLRSTSLFPRVIPLFPLLLFSYVLLYCLGTAARASLKLSLFRERAL